jgi:hypothetical protein
MANVKYFNGTTLLTGIQTMGRKEFEARFPGVVGRRADSFSFYVGQPEDFAPVFVQGKGWDRNLLPVQRVVTFKSNPSRHLCDSRCYNATGRTMQCECSCGGKNHGQGAFNCTAEAA